MLSGNNRNPKKSPLFGNPTYVKDGKSYVQHAQGFGFMSGVKSNNFKFSRKDNDWKAMESAGLVEQAENMSKKHLTRYTRHYDEDGNLMPFAVHNNRVYNTGPRGLKFVDGSLLQKQRQMENEAMEEIEQRVKQLLINTETTKRLLGLSNAEYNDLFGSNPSAEWYSIFETDPELANASCKVDFLCMRNRLGDTSAETVKGMLKLTLIAKAFTFIIDRSGMDDALEDTGENDEIQFEMKDPSTAVKLGGRASE